MNKKLANSTQHFYLACLVKLEEKEKAGWGGWDKTYNKELFEEDVTIRAKKPLTQSNLVDISNYCNFLWNLLEVNKGGN